MAESKMFRTWGAEVVGMTLVPECVLAREAQICYASIATVTDYDCWKDHAVCAIEIAQTMKENIEKVRDLVSETVRAIPLKKTCKCEEDFRNASV
jgi:5'-methylthioadenosine phosphorylase